MKVRKTRNVRIGRKGLLSVSQVVVLVFALVVNILPIVPLAQPALAAPAALPALASSPRVLDAANVSAVKADVASANLSSASSAPLAPGVGPGICSNNKTIACSANSDCGTGNTCYIPTAGGQTLSNQVCMQTAAGFGLQCSANDISLALTSGLQVIDGCAFPGDTATISFVGKFQLTAQDRYIECCVLDRQFRYNPFRPHVIIV